MIKKESGNPDPAQKRLRDLKKDWNKEVSSLIAQIIAFKKGINGKGEPTVGLPPSDIKNPFPGEIESYLQNMENRFNIITNTAGKIIDFQEEYSRVRNKGKKESSKNQEMMVFGSSKLSRFWTFVNQYPLFSNDSLTKGRIRLLNSITDIKSNINETEAILTSSDESALPHSFYNFINLLNVFKGQFDRKFENLLELQLYALQDFVKEEGKLPIQTNEKAEDSTKEQTVKQINDSSSVLDFLNKDLGYFKPLLETINRKIETGTLDKSKIDILSIINLYDKIQALAKKLHISDDKGSERYMKSLNLAQIMHSDILAKINDIPGVGKVSTLESAFDTISKIASLSNFIIKQSDKNLKRWLNRMKLNILPDELDRMKLDLANDLNLLSKEFNKLMNSLEDKKANLSVISTDVHNIYQLIAQICEQFKEVGVYYNFQQQSKKFKNKDFKSKTINESHISHMTKAQSFFKDRADKVLSKSKDVSQEGN